MKDLRPNDCCGSSKEGEDSEENTGENTDVDNLVMMRNDDDDSDPEGEVEKRETAPFEFQSFEASNRGQFSCRCTLDQWLDLIGVISS